MGYFEQLADAIVKSREDSEVYKKESGEDLRVYKMVMLEIWEELAKEDGAKKIYTITRKGISSDLLTEMATLNLPVKKCYIRAWGRYSITDLYNFAEKVEGVLNEGAEVIVADIAERNSMELSLLLVLKD